MGKVSKKNLVGQPVFKQIINIIPKEKFDELVIKTQVWCTLTAFLLLQVIQTKSESKKAFSTMAALLRMHLISHLDLTWVVTEGRHAYPNRMKSRNKSPSAAQLSLF